MIYRGLLSSFTCLMMAAAAVYLLASAMEQVKTYRVLKDWSPPIERPR